MTLTDREKALVEAARAIFNTPLGNHLNTYPLQAALRAYDPPKPKVYTMPSWEEFAAKYGGPDRDRTVPLEDAEFKCISQSDYNAIREALAKDSE